MLRKTINLLGEHHVLITSPKTLCIFKNLFFLLKLYDHKDSCVTHKLLLVSPVAVATKQYLPALSKLVHLY